MPALFGASQQFVAGSYAFYANGCTLGIVEDAPNLLFRPGEEIITGDHLGDGIVGVIDRGGNAYLALTAQEWGKDAVQALSWPRGNPWVDGTYQTAWHGLAGQVGCLRGRVAISAIALNNSCAQPIYFEALNAMLAPGFEVNLSMGSRLRRVDLLLLLGGYIDPDDGTYRFYRFRNQLQEKLWTSGRSYQAGEIVKSSVTNQVFLAQPNPIIRSVTQITQASAGVVTSTAHGLENGQRVTLSSVVGMKEVNGKTFTIANKTNDTFEINQDTTGFVAYSSGGVATTAPGVSAGDATDLAGGTDTGSGFSWLNLSA